MIKKIKTHNLYQNSSKKLIIAKFKTVLNSVKTVLTI